MSMLPIAAHEAGHAVAVLALGAELRGVEIKSARRGFTHWFTDGLSRTEEAAIVYAGPLAQIGHGLTDPMGTFQDWGAGDLERINALGLDPSARSRSYFLASKIVSANARAISLLAGQLEHWPIMSGAEVGQLLCGKVRSVRL